MPDIVKSDSQLEFARAFGDALWKFLDGRMTQIDATKLLGLLDKNGKPKRSTLNSYFRDSADGKRIEPLASVLFLACTRLPGFYFDHDGYRLKAVRLDKKKKTSDATYGQLPFNFQRRFDLVEQAGKLNVKVKRPSGRIEVSVSLDAKAS